MDPNESTEDGMENCTANNDEDLYICDQDSVDSTAEEMFIDGLDPVLDRPSLDIYTPEEDCDSEANIQQRKRCRLHSTSSTVGGDGRESENDGVSTERWHSSDETDVEPLQIDFTPVQVPGPKHLPHKCSSPLQFFQLFPKIMMQSIVGHTNVYGTKCKDVDSQEVQMCSTFHKAYEGDTVQRKVKSDSHRTLVEVPIPAVVLDYNRNVGTVEPSNFITGHYRVLHKPKKWYQCVFYHLLDIAVENAFILHELVAERKKQKALTRKTFLETLVLELTGMDAENRYETASFSLPYPAAPISSPLSTPVSAPPTAVLAPPTPPESSPPEGSHRPKHFVPDSTVGRRKCKLCQLKTPVICVTCEVPLCFQPKHDCFNQWHEKQGV